MPYLIPDLRLALASLYSLPGGKPSSESEAHEYLLQFQARNPHRKLHAQLENQKENPAQPPKSYSDDAGSTWMACVDIVSSFSKSSNHNPDQNNQEVHYAEALFAAQTLVHRLRRVKLAEAIDIEFEPNFFDSPSIVSCPPRPEQVLDGYRRWILEYYRGATSSSSFAMLFQLVQSYHPAVDPQQQTSAMELVERIKGELSMMILASIMDALTKKYYEQQLQHQDEQKMLAQIRPLLKTLALVLAAIAIRMRYVSTSLPLPASHTQPIVTTIIGAITMVQVSSQRQQHDTSQEIFRSLCYLCLTALPEAVLTGSNNNGGGGAYGRFSLDPRCYTAVTTELKTQGMVQVCQSIQNLLNSNLSNHSTSSVPLFQMCEAWGKYVPLPIDFVNNSVPLILQAWEQLRSSHQDRPQGLAEAKAAMAYWIAVMEGGTWTIDQVLTSSLVQSKEGSRQPNKKKQSSKSKKRNQQLVEEKITNEVYTSACNEVQQRGQVACTMAQQTLTVLQELLMIELRRIADLAIEEQDVQGDGPVGAITTCANACLPYLLRASIVHQDKGSMELFVSIGQLIQQVCASPSSMVRSFASESLFTLHEALVKSLTDNQNISPNKDFFEAVIKHFFQSSINLSFQCGYPQGYFTDLGKDNDEDLESERNDVREVLRTVSAIPSTISKRNRCHSTFLILTTSSILFRLMQACAQPIREAVGSNTLFPEPALHAFSALAKPINSIASLYSEDLTQGTENENFVTILKLAFEITSNAGRCLLYAFPLVSVNEVLPLSRLYNLAIASLSPMFSTLGQIPSIESEVKTVMSIGVQAAATSMMKIPELTGPSTLRQTRYDIRGAMRSPGGEDHVGVLTLMRLANESNSLSLMFLKTNESILVELCGLYQELKKIEDERGIGVFYGTGVLPKSRRILLGIICHLEIISGGTGQASRILVSMFENAISSIANINNQLGKLEAKALSLICENTFDIAAFSPNVVHSLFATSDSAASQAVCLHVLHQAGNFGFLSLQDANIQYESIVQWNRLRAALFTLLKMTGNPDLPSSIIEILISLVVKECETVMIQCSAGPTSPSKIFNEVIISEETIPPGIFIRVVVETLDKAFSTQTPISEMRNTLHVLYATRHAVLHTLISECSMPVQKGSFEDPRPVIAETWILCMNRISTAAADQGGIDAQEAIGVGVLSVIKQLLADTFVAVISLLLYSSLEKTQEKRANDPGMSLDGPQGLVMMDFFVAYFNLGNSMIQFAAKELIATVPVDVGNDPDAAGMAIIGAALFRGSQGGLPPWAVESTPTVYSSLFKALNNNVDNFGLMLQISMNVRLVENQRFGSVRGGSLLSGKFFEKMNDKSKLSFIDQAKDHAKNNTTASWRRLKALIKQACGGKKKDTDFKQRPALTSWDTLDRV
mmetsp:Transcript_27547/g.59322  ORF Transcript_27547/g.59322 Transcript_27547/m.59322 type:complete len:1400 (+) Transcript_27547:106-4305(+)